jgi:hypothetical protein
VGNTFIGRDADFDTPGATGNNNTLLGLDPAFAQVMVEASALI